MQREKKKTARKRRKQDGKSFRVCCAVDERSTTKKTKNLSVPRQQLNEAEWFEFALLPP